MTRRSHKRAPSSAPALEQLGEIAAWEAPVHDESEEHPGLGAHSPLWMVTTEPLLNEFVLDLHRLREELMREPDTAHLLHFSRSYLERVRAAFANMIRHGEEKLHQLSQLFCESFLDAVQIQSVVIGEVENTRERFTLTRGILAADLYSTTDIDLGNRQLNKLRFLDGEVWSKATLVANVVDYQPTEPNSYGIHRITSRIKAEEEIWNKVVDEIFDLDSIVKRDKKLRHLSRFVKDIFGIKIVVGELRDAYCVQSTLQGLVWSEAQLRKLSIEPTPEAQRLQLVEVKDYLTQQHKKRSGWTAIKSVVRWSDKTFEIQIQPLPNFLGERELLTRESHISFKASREQVRDQVAQQVPLFGFYRDLLRWLFLAPAGPAPMHPGVTVELVD